MILSFIQDIENVMSQQAKLNAQQTDSAQGSLSESGPEPVKGSVENSVNENITEQAGNEITDRNKEPDRIQYSYDNSFESKYVHFKEKIEKDRLAWETFSNRK